jgi:hypothetical protein
LCIRSTIGEAPYDTAAGAALARASIGKQFFGDLEATSRVEMLSAVTEIKGSAGYVAIERVMGRLNGRTGTFVLQHSGLMLRGKSELTIVVVPDSATGELKGLAGKMTIDIVEVVDSKHFYGLDYTLDAAD